MKIKKSLNEAVEDSMKDNNANMHRVKADAVVNPVYKSAVEDDEKASKSFAQVMRGRKKVAKEAKVDNQFANHDMVVKRKTGNRNYAESKKSRVFRKGLFEERQYDLVPSNRKSFYGKAKVVDKGNGEYELRSYDTIVSRAKNGKVTHLGKYSPTTTRHQREFEKQFTEDTKRVSVNKEDMPALNLIVDYYNGKMSLDVLHNRLKRYFGSTMVAYKFLTDHDDLARSIADGTANLTEELTLFKDEQLPNWRGCSNIQFRHNGAWSDPDIIYNGYTFNYWDIEDALWDMFLEDTGYSDSMSDDPQVEKEFNEFCQKEASWYLEEVIDGGYFGDGRHSWHDRYNEGCGRKSKKKSKKMTESIDNDKVVWSSTGTEDYIYSSDRDTLLYDFGANLEEMDVDVDKLTDDELADTIAQYFADPDFDYEDLREGVIPEIEKQCYNDMIWFVGKYQRWDGGRDAVGYFDHVAKGITDVCYPNYDSHSELYTDENGNLWFTEYTHDAPTGGTAMQLFSFKDRNAFDRADTDNEDGADGVYYDSEDPKTVHSWIEKGYLTPIKL